MPLYRTLGMWGCMLCLVGCVHQQDTNSAWISDEDRPLVARLIRKTSPGYLLHRLKTRRHQVKRQQGEFKWVKDADDKPINKAIHKALNQAINKPRKALSKRLTTFVRSRYGNPALYHVNGETYEVQSSSKGYKERGLASWYGAPFHQARTSSGEIYDMYGMTAAHKTLPLPTVVKVTNLENKRHVIVKVNDRGPFHTGRIIDLSYAAAKALQLDKKGVGRVEVESLTNKDAPDPHWFLQVGAFDKLSQAQKLAKYISSFIQLPIAIIDDKGNNLVQIGPFQDKAERKAVQTLLLRHGIRDMFAFIR